MLGVDQARRGLAEETPAPELPLLQPATSSDAQMETDDLEEPLSEAASPETWRRRALKLHVHGRHKESVTILEKSMDAFKEQERLGDIADVVAEKSATMHMLISAYLMEYLSNPQVLANGKKEEAAALLTRANNLLEQVSKLDDNDAEKMKALDGFVNGGFHALAQYKHRHTSGSSYDLTRANLLFSEALKLDSTAPRAIFGKASVFMHWKEWGKALDLLRQIIHRRPSPSLMKEVKFAMAMCFCGMERFDQTRNALMGVLAIDPDDVETLCALAHLDAKEASDGQGQSQDYLAQAVQKDHRHPVVLCHMANSAFLVGLESPGAERAQAGGPWAVAADLLQQALLKTTSREIKAEAHYQLGRLHHAQDRFREAKEEYQKCRHLSPEHYVCQFNFAQTCVELKGYQEAIDVLEALRKKRSTNRDVLKLLTFTYILSENKEAVAVAQALCAPGVGDDDVEAWAMLAEAHEQRYAQGSEEAVKAAHEAYEKVRKLLEEGKNVDQANPQMWNNLGTLRGLDGDAAGAEEAYDKALKLIDRKKNINHNDEDSKDIHITELTVRFNRAWLNENGEQPDNLLATEDLLKLREEASWYADVTLRLGAQWLMIGDFERAARTYEEASKQAPVIAAIMQSQVYKQQGELTKALRAAEKAVQRATPKEYHYVHVYFGNLCYEFSQSSHIHAKQDRDKYLGRALWHFMEAFNNAKDSHFAANGIGMVFAQRGQLEFAKRTFQSVLQHTGVVAGSGGDPSVFTNLGHVYVESGGNEARKAIAHYEKARKLKPGDMSIRLYLARAHFQLQEHERCSGIISEALSIWPDNLVLRYNLALSLERWGGALVHEEGKVDRVVGIESGRDKMERATEVLKSAAFQYGQIYKRWESLSKDAQRMHSLASPAPAKFLEEMSRVKYHQEYCLDITDKARATLEALTRRRTELDDRMKNIEEKKSKEAKEKEVQEQQETERAAERRQTIEEDALRLINEVVPDMNEGLGKNLGETGKLQADANKAAANKTPRVKGSREPAKAKRDDIQRTKIDVQAITGEPAEPEFDEEGNPLPVKPKARAKSKSPRPPTKKALKKQKKEMKKQKKKEKKEARKAQEGDEGEGGRPDPDEPTLSLPDPDKLDGAEKPERAEKPEGAERAEEGADKGEDRQARLPIQEDGDGAEPEPGGSDAGSDEGRSKRKEDKKAKKQAKKEVKKAKKDAKKQAKKRKRGAEDDGEADDDGDGVVEGEGDVDQKDVEELFDD